MIVEFRVVHVHSTHTQKHTYTHDNKGLRKWPNLLLLRIALLDQSQIRSSFFVAWHPPSVLAQLVWYSPHQSNNYMKPSGVEQATDYYYFSNLDTKVVPKNHKHYTRMSLILSSTVGGSMPVSFWAVNEETKWAQKWVKKCIKSNGWIASYYITCLNLWLLSQITTSEPWLL